jgi:putative DNA primase/helicase
MITVENRLTMNVPDELSSESMGSVGQKMRGGKSTKVAYSAHNGQPPRRINQTLGLPLMTPISWLNNSGFSRLGFIFSPDDPYIGIDLDKCRDGTAGEIKPWAREWIDSLRSYTERSQSGIDVHIIIKGTLPGQKRKRGVERGAIEVYDRSRYLVMTGDRLSGTPETIEDRTEKLSELCESVFANSERRCPRLLVRNQRLNQNRAF